jgi:hypothetical protein
LSSNLDDHKYDFLAGDRRGLKDTVSAKFSNALTELELKTADRFLFSFNSTNADVLAKEFLKNPANSAALKLFVSWRLLLTSYYARLWAAAHYTEEALAYLLSSYHFLKENSKIVSGNPGFNSAHLTLLFASESHENRHHILSQLAYRSEFLPTFKVENEFVVEATAVADFIRRNPELQEYEKELPDEWLLALYLP